jgi:hypothetical protein
MTQNTKHYCELGLTASEMPEPLYKTLKKKTILNLPEMPVNFPAPGKGSPGKGSVRTHRRKELRRRKKTNREVYGVPWRHIKKVIKKKGYVVENNPVHCSNQTGARTADLCCCGHKMHFESFRAKGRPGRKPVNQVVYVCHVCGHHKWQNIKGRIPQKYASRNIVLKKDLPNDLDIQLP